MVGGGAGATWWKKETGLERIGGGGARGAPAVPTDGVSGGRGWEAAVAVEWGAGGGEDRCRRRAPAVGAR